VSVKLPKFFDWANATARARRIGAWKSQHTKIFEWTNEPYRSRSRSTLASCKVQETVCLDESEMSSRSCPTGRFGTWWSCTKRLSGWLGGCLWCCSKRFEWPIRAIVFIIALKLSVLTNLRLSVKMSETFRLLELEVHFPGVWKGPSGRNRVLVNVCETER